LAKYIITLLLLTLCAGESYAQRMMLLQRGGNQKTRIIYQEGEQLIYRQKGVNYFYEDVIREIHSDFLVLTDNIIRPEEIEVIDIRRKDERNQTLKNISTLAYSAGALVLTIETINSLYLDGSLNYSTGGLIIAGSLFAGGAIISLTRYKYFRHQGRNKIQLILLETD